MKQFQLFKNGRYFKKIKAKSFELAKGDAILIAKSSKNDYFEIKEESGKLCPIFVN